MNKQTREDDRPVKESELIESFKSICRQAGLKVTHQRLEIFRALAAAKDHPTVEEVYERVRAKVPTMALDTVYRTLATLEKSGVLTRINLDPRNRYDPNKAIHHHLICTECHRIEDFYWPTFDQMKVPSRKPGWGSIRSKQVEVRGVCSACMKKKK